MQGIHDNYGIMLDGIVAYSKISYASVSFVIAVGQIMYGITQPFFGMLAIKKSNAFVMFAGIILMAAGLIVTPFCTQVWSLLIFFGILLPAGTGALCFGIIMGALAPIIGEKRAAVASGIIQASAGIGDAIMSPILQQLTEFKGITVSMPVFSAPILLMLPVVLWLGYKKRKTNNEQNEQIQLKEDTPKESLFTILKSSLCERTYWCLLIGFSTCGFHMSIIETHLFSQYIESGIPGNLASLTLTVYGIFTMLGAIITGFLGQKLRMKNILTGVYGIRILIALAFIFIPKSIPFAFIATGILGLTGDSTVPPTTGIISNKVGVAKMAVVYGSIFIGHQIGAFASAWLGGILVSTNLGYNALWIVDLCLCTIAAAA
ncbi:MAG: MFS transporter, partial [Eubacterium sp.]|nr:MFS transporter [Eubacterium sp.]